MAEPLLLVKNLHLSFRQNQAEAMPILQGIDFSMDPGEAVALTGSSGCGKSILARALCGLLPSNTQTQGSIFWRGEELAVNRQNRWKPLRGGAMTLILQEPATSLNPVRRVGSQIAEAWALHHPAGELTAKSESLKLLEEVRLPSPLEISQKYPHQLSGGMRQRVLLAAALACEPDLLVADEPTAALDPTVQLEILALIKEIRRNREMALLFISHDPFLVSLMTDRSYLMNKGKLKEGIFASDLPSEDPTVTLRGADTQLLKPVLKGRNLVVEYQSNRWYSQGNRAAQGFRAVDNVDLDLFPGQALGLAGESGCGKTSLARALVCQIPLKAGTLESGQKDLTALRGEDLRAARRAGQLVYQDPVASLNPRQRMGEMLDEALMDPNESIEKLLAEVGLETNILQRYPHQLSGGQNQRIALARALSVDPKVIIADEVTSALDPLATRRIMSLLAKVMEERNLAVLHISHDLDLLDQWCHQIMVMSRGVILEVYPGLGRSKARHPYTRELLSARPNALRADQWQRHGGNKSSNSAKHLSGQGCPWAPFCNEVISSCYKVLPPLGAIGDGHLSRCPVVEQEGSSTFIDT